MTNVITNKSNGELSNMSLPLINKAKKIDSGNKGIDDPYGLPKGVEEPKRAYFKSDLRPIQTKESRKRISILFYCHRRL